MKRLKRGVGQCVPQFCMYVVCMWVQCMYVVCNHTPGLRHVTGLWARPVIRFNRSAARVGTGGRSFPPVTGSANDNHTGVTERRVLGSITQPKPLPEGWSQKGREDVGLLESIKQEESTRDHQQSRDGSNLIPKTNAVLLPISSCPTLTWYPIIISRAASLIDNRRL